ncbi:two-component system sensor histidine kinase NtrB [Xylophilus sp. ASV27]|uniref:two-component system sensor histidine kinase NtrB n=1 Tax=Xylophilus sp. ASV27 TaxID=2795129 RepID=UPI0018EB4E4B|nr:ATP-binding protein [Xylophilus sp. ASV27]
MSAAPPPEGAGPGEAGPGPEPALGRLARLLWRLSWRLQGSWRRWSLWLLLAVLVVAMLVILVWLAGRYEASQLQSRIERDAADAVSDIRSGLARNVQSLQALQASDPLPAEWGGAAAQVLRAHRELMRLEWRDAGLRLLAHADTPYRTMAFDAPEQELQASSDTQLTCAAARRLNGPNYSSSYFVPRADGLGLEVVELCLPLTRGSRINGYLVAIYGLPEILSDLIGPQVSRHQEISFTEADGTRLASLHGAVRRGTRKFSAQQLLDLPGSALVLRLDSWHGAPNLFPNVLTALVTFMSIALVSVLVLLVKDNRLRLQAERDLADALAFRKAMEDSLVTGLRARDLEGRITYVNPAFCKMVGFAAEELLGRVGEPPYWPPERADEYLTRQVNRFAGELPPRDGYESLFMRKDGTRFPVLIIEAPLINAQGLHTGWMGAFLDLSEQRRIEELSRASLERLQATARLATVGEMASLLSHELNQPLAAISSYATGSINLLRHEYAPLSGAGAAPAVSADLELAMRRIAEQAERAGRVIRSVHDFVRRREHAREATSARELLDAIMPLVNLQARKLGVQVRCTLESGLPRVLCDRTMVEQVLLNLARNAMQAMDRPGVLDRRLELGVRRAVAGEDGGWVEFLVTDNGPGIPADVAARLFTPFFTTKPEGMGLGLSLCRTVVEQHGGFLAHAPGASTGTVFSFTLPAMKPA